MFDNRPRQTGIEPLRCLDRHANSGNHRPSSRGGTVHSCSLFTFWSGELIVKKTDGMRRPVSDGMLYAPKLSTCC